MANLDEQIQNAMWAGDEDELHRLAPCRCCCHEHTFAPHCPAYAWGGCRGQATPAEEERIEGYAEHYARTRGMTREEFFEWGELHSGS